MMNRRFVVVAILVVAALLGVRAWKLTAGLRSLPSCPDCNILLIVIDPLRADALGSLGNPRAATPVLDALAKRGYLFDNAVAVAPWTLPSAMSLITGVNPSSHRITNKDIVISDTSRDMVPANLATASAHLTTVASELKNAGYSTGGFAGGTALARSYGFDMGFDEYYGGEGFRGLSEAVPKALDFVRRHKNQRLFVMVHGFDVHGQYVPEEGYDRRYADAAYDGKLSGSAEEQKKLREEGVMLGRTFLRSEDRDFLRALYDEKTARMDASVGAFLEAYGKEVPLDKTILVFTSNHGEEFYEHGRIDHGMTLYDEVVRIPLVIVMPGITAPARIAAQVRNIDIAPTVLSLIGRKPSRQFGSQLEGVSLTPLMQGRHITLDAYPETAYRYASFMSSVRTGDGWKLTVNSETQEKQLFRLTEDAGETNNLFTKYPEKAGELMRKLENYRKTQRPERGGDGT